MGTETQLEVAPSVFHDPIHRSMSDQAGPPASCISRAPLMSKG